MRMIIFDDGRHDLAPMTDLRAVFEIRTGILTVAERIVRVRTETLAGYWVRDEMKRLVAERAGAPVNPEFSDEAVTVVNGRWLNPDRALTVDLGQALVQTDSGDIIIAAMSGTQAVHFLSTGNLPDDIDIATVDQAWLFTHPWEVIKYRDELNAIDIKLYRLVEALVPQGGMSIVGDHPVEIHRTANIYPGVVFDAEGGTIIVDENAIIRPRSILCGPCYVGRRSMVVDGALIKPNTMIGPVCKVGGEVGGTIFQGYSNKSHDGHLGDSWVGEWVNFGAGTTNSNLLNTYDEVSMCNCAGGQQHRTGLTFLGAIIGDHVKLAINTRLMTGAVIGTGAMIARSTPPPPTVEPFAWMTDEATRRYRLNKFIEVARTMMARRHVEPSPAYIEAIERLHAKRPS